MRFMTAAAFFSFTAAAAFSALAGDASPAAPTPALAMPNAATLPMQPEPNLKAMEHTSNSNLVKDAPLPGDFVMGSKTAPLVMIEYASLSCPHCAHFSNTTLPLLIKKYVNTGKMRYVMRPFPLNEPALKGAVLLQCVGEQDSRRYYAFAKVLFDAQNKWAFDANYLANLQTIAEVGGVSKAQFDHCMGNTDMEVKVLKVKKLANDELRVPHTPYIFIGGQVYDGSRDIVPMSLFIDKKLAELKQGKQ
ncbi:MAG: DsbA family protein [Pseudomonadota bacterium]|nr:DsbA family protein [Pseudomonadota bacterium]